MRIRDKFEKPQFRNFIKESTIPMATGSVVTWSFLPGLSGLKISFANQKQMKGNTPAPIDHVYLLGFSMTAVGTSATFGPDKR